MKTRLEFDKLEPIAFLAPDEDNLIEVTFQDTSAFLDKEDAEHLRDWLSEIYPDD